MATRVLIANSGGQKKSERLYKELLGILEEAEVTFINSDEGNLPKDEEVYDLLIFTAYCPLKGGAKLLGLGDKPEWQNEHDRMEEEAGAWLHLLLQTAKPGAVMVPVSSVTRWVTFAVEYPQQKCLVVPGLDYDVQARVERGLALRAAIRS